METKFDLGVFVEKENTFLEYGSLAELLEERGESYKQHLIGYFPPKSNMTYEELEGLKIDQNLTIAYHKGKKGGSVSEHTLLSMSTLELKRKLPEIIDDARGKEDVTIYRNKDFVYV